MHKQSSAVDSVLNAELVEMPKVNLCHQQHKGNFPLLNIEALHLNAELSLKDNALEIEDKACLSVLFSSLSSLHTMAKGTLAEFPLAELIVLLWLCLPSLRVEAHPKLQC